MKSIVLTLVAAAATGTAPPPPGIVIPAGLVDRPLALLDAAAGELAANAYVDGTYTGPVVDAYWGPIQVQAVVQGGRIASLKMLRYPNDRRESLFISQLSLPRLRDEVVKAQSARVDVVSGATLTSEAFMRSLEGALTAARGSAL